MSSEHYLAIYYYFFLLTSFYSYKHILLQINCDKFIILNYYIYIYIYIQKLERDYEYMWIMYSIINDIEWNY